MNLQTLSTLLLLALAGVTHAADWTVQPQQSELRFIGSMQGESFEGGFGRFQADIRFDPAELSTARFEVSVDLASADSANAERDEALLSPEFFNVEASPTARYSASRFRAEGDAFVAEGSLSLNGKTHPVPLTFQWTQTAEGAVLEGSAQLDRLQFDVGAGDWSDPGMIGHEVQVRTRLVLSPATQ